MRWLRATLVMVLGWMLMGHELLAWKGAPPSSDRSERAIEKVRPDLAERLRAKGMRWGDPVFIRIFKRNRELELWVRKGEAFALFETYPICRYSGELGPKLKEGDLQAPEGFYEVTPKLMNPWSQFHLSFNIGYPNTFDRAHGRTGSYIMVHGNCVSTGCFAMTDAKIEEIYALVDAALRKGQKRVPVHVFPFPLTEERLAPMGQSPWLDFWQNLKEGYDYFETRKTLPKVGLERGRYSFR